jgi:hypothetical protein
MGSRIIYEVEGERHVVEVGHREEFYVLLPVMAQIAKDLFMTALCDHRATNKTANQEAIRREREFHVDSLRRSFVNLEHRLRVDPIIKA